MSGRAPLDLVLENVLVPRSLLRDASGFGGVPEQECLAGDLVICDGLVRGLEARADTTGAQGIVMPLLSECHVHLDKCHTISRMGGVGGDLRAAIDAQRMDRALWTPEDLRQRAERGLGELIGAGCGTVRSHVDWSAEEEATTPPVAWHVLTELAQDYADRVQMQVAPLTNTTDLADPDRADAIGRIIAERNGVLGLFVLDQPDRQAGVAAAFRVADKYGLALDFHVDEGLAPGLDGLEIIADTALKTGFQGPILCGHACSLMNRTGDDLQRLLEKLARAGITVASLPSSNLYLQGRGDGAPDRRGLTRIRELQAAGVPVAVGTDNVRDAFCPLGRHDPRHSLALAALAAHLDPPFGDYLPMITTNAQTGLGLAPLFVDGAAIGDLLLFDATSTADLLAGGSAPRPLAAVVKGETS
ncbi:MAG: amidohydrolase family protein [Rhodobacteraceae bacterium]|nr:amidohydrolase family protein [Paracoccaceae bacterium]